jgi:hypothetical protein
MGGNYEKQFEINRILYPLTGLTPAAVVIDHLNICAPTKYFHSHQTTSKEAVKKIPDGSVHAIFIDGCHFYECIEEDLRLWIPKVR